MAIIFSKKGQKAQKLDPSDFDQEDHLQRYIHENPEAVPLYDIKEDAKLIILAREFSTSSGPIDAVGIDADGEVYLVETKLYKNPDKRNVVAQVMDYGAALWKNTDFSGFTDRINDEVQKKFKVSLFQKIQTDLGVDENNAKAIWEAVGKNLKEGRYKFVVLMDKLDSRLKDLIIYLNQNSKFDLYAVELEYYQHDGLEIVVPRIFGAEIKKETGPARQTTAWDKDSFFQDAEKYLEKDEMEHMRSFVEFLSKETTIKYGTGATRASFSVQIPYKGQPLSILEVASTGRLYFYLALMAGRGISENELKDIVKQLTTIDKSFTVSGDVTHSYSMANIQELKKDDQIEKLQELISHLQKSWAK